VVSVNSEADEIINGDRRDDYGDVTQSFTTIGELWAPIFGHRVSPHEVALCMIQLKVARYLHGHQRDSLVDICGYAGCLDMIRMDEEET